MGYTVEPINVTGTPKERIIDPRSKKSRDTNTRYNWWNAQSDQELVEQLLSTTDYLKRVNQQQIRMASIFTRLLCGKPLYNFLASNATLDTANQLPMGRPTANVCYSCTDTIVSRISQDNPSPTFLTTAGDYRQRKLSTDATQFIEGEFYRTKFRDLTPLALRDACGIGDGLIKIFPKDSKVCAERTLRTETLTDYNDAYYGNPRELIQMKLVDRGVFMALFPDKADMIASATHGNVDTTPRSVETVADQFIIAEGWHLPSNEGASDGRHAIVCSEGVILDEVYTKDRFPFVKIGYNPNIVGWISQGLVEILMPSQMEIYRQLIVGSQNFELMGVPRILVEEMSKILETSFNNRIGSIIKYRNTPPEFVNANPNSDQWFQYVLWLIQNCYQMCGVSSLSANGQKPAGLNSGDAIRDYDQLQDDRFAALSKRYQNMYPDAAHLYLDCAKEIFEETGKYTTVYPGPNGLHELDFRQLGLLKDTYVIQLKEESSLPKDPAGRQAKLSEMFAAQEITAQEFRRLSRMPDLEQSDQLAVALEERILHDLDAIIDDGKKGYSAPDRFMLDPTNLATTLTVQYINKYSVTNIDQERLDLLRDYYTALLTIQNQVAQEAQAQAMTQQQAQALQQPLQVQPPNPSISPTSGAQV